MGPNYNFYHQQNEKITYWMGEHLQTVWQIRGQNPQFINSSYKIYIYKKKTLILKMGRRLK